MKTLTAFIFFFKVLEIFKIVVYSLDRVWADEMLLATERTLTETFYVQMWLVLGLFGQFYVLFFMYDQKVVIGKILVDRVRLERRVADLNADAYFFASHKYWIRFAYVSQAPKQYLR